MTEEEIAKNKEILEFIRQSMSMSTEIMKLYSSALKSKNKAAIQVAQDMLSALEESNINTQLKKSDKTKTEWENLIKNMSTFIQHWKPQITIHTYNTETKVRAN